MANKPLVLEKALEISFIVQLDEVVYNDHIPIGGWAFIGWAEKDFQGNHNHPD